jgi:flagellar motor switch protein FliN/FliY
MSNRLDGVDNARTILDQWTESLAQVLESMTDQRPEVSWEFFHGSAAEAAGAAAGDLLWWQQAFHSLPDEIVWLATPQATWEQAGTLTLKAAGLETVEIGEARNTWFEIVGQSFGAMARSLGALVGHEVTCDAGGEKPSAPEIQDWAKVTLTFGGTPSDPLLIAFDEKLLETLASPRPTEPAQPVSRPPEPQAVQASEPVPNSRTMELLLDVDLPVSISFGKARLPMKDVLKLTTGSIVELNRSVNDQVEVLVNHCLIARGEVVVVEGNYGVRIQEIATRQERLRSIV